MARSMMPLASLLVALLVLAGCGAPAASGGATPAAGDIANRPIKVVTTTGMIADAARNVGGARVEVTALMGPGVDPHLYKATASDVTLLDNADIIFYNGLELEGRLTDVLVKMSRSRPTMAVTEDIPLDELREPAELQGKHDPHVWFDVMLWKHVVRSINRHLAEVDPASRSLFQQQTDAYLAQLDDLHGYAQTQIERIPAESRVLITAHDAFGYFGDRYGVEVRGLQGTSTATEAGAGDVQALVDFIVARKTKAIFVESSVPEATIKAVQAAAQAKGQPVTIGGQLFSDAMGADGTLEGTYIGMVRHNVDMIVAALR